MPLGASSDCANDESFRLVSRAFLSTWCHLLFPLPKGACEIVLFPHRRRGPKPTAPKRARTNSPIVLPANFVFSTSRARPQGVRLRVCLQDAASALEASTARPHCVCTNAERPAHLATFERGLRAEPALFLPGLLPLLRLCFVPFFFWMGKGERSPIDPCHTPVAVFPYFSFSCAVDKWPCVKPTGPQLAERQVSHRAI